MESMMSGTLAGTGSFRCEECGYVVTLSAEDALPRCPGCNGTAFARASLFTGGRFARAAQSPRSADEQETLRTRIRGAAEDADESAESALRQAGRTGSPAPTGREDKSRKRDR